MVRVRFAPSPTGFLHIGGLRTALYNELFAKRHQGTFILRIEDTDRTRLVAGGVENIIRTLNWAGIEPQEGPYLDADGQVKERGGFGPYVQSQRLDIYRTHCDDLLGKGAAYRCFCTAERLEEMKARQTAEKRMVMYDKACRKLSEAEARERMARGEPNVVRLRVPDEGKTEFEDAIRGGVSFENCVVDDQVLMKSDGFPTYHLANVVDDHLMGITHVIRGEEWLPSTPKHILLYRAFGWEPPTFAHLPLLLNPDRSKLSKRQGDVAAEDYRRQGYLPEAIVNFVALLGWNPSGSQEKYAKEELAKGFALERINKAGAVFNREKLDWFNREYLKDLSDERFAALALPFFLDAGLLVKEGERLSVSNGMRPITEGYFAKAISLERPRVKTLAELPAATAFLFVDLPEYEAAILVWKKSDAATAKDRLTGLRARLAGTDEGAFGSPASLEAAIMACIAENGWTNGEALWPLRVALTGREASPSPFEVVWALGKGETLRRIDHAIAKLV